MRNYTLSAFAFAFIVRVNLQFCAHKALKSSLAKNRVQYHEDFKEWLQYESVNFITYFYGEGRNIAQAVVQLAELRF